MKPSDLLCDAAVAEHHGGADDLLHVWFDDD